MNQDNLIEVRDLAVEFVVGDHCHLTKHSAPP